MFGCRELDGVGVALKLCGETEHVDRPWNEHYFCTLLFYACCAAIAGQKTRRELGLGFGFKVCGETEHVASPWNGHYFCTLLFYACCAALDGQW